MGWFAQPMDPALNSAMQHVKQQLHLLWNAQMIDILLGRFLAKVVNAVEPPQVSNSPIHNSHFSGTSFLKRALESRSNKVNVQKTYRSLGSPEVHRVVVICSLYHTALNTLTQMQLDILTGKKLCMRYIYINFFYNILVFCMLIVLRIVLSRWNFIQFVVVSLFSWTNLWFKNFFGSSCY